MERLYQNVVEEDTNTIKALFVRDLDIRALAVTVSEYSPEGGSCTKRAVYIQLRKGGQVHIFPATRGECEKLVDDLALAYEFEFLKKHAERHADIFTKLG